MEDNWPSLPSGNSGNGVPSWPPPPLPTASVPASKWGPAPPPAAAPVQPQPQPAAVPKRGCSSSAGVKVAVVDANAVIAGAHTIAADRLVTVSGVLDEIRDEAARRRLTLTPIPIETLDPPSEFVKKVVKFARETGDLQTLSEVDIKVIALTYMLEAQTHGTSHLRESPPPLHVVNAPKFQDDMPGWGSNVPNLAEWEALDQLSDVGHEIKSRILPAKDLGGEESLSMSEQDDLHARNEGLQTSVDPEESQADKVVLVNRGGNVDEENQESIQNSVCPEKFHDAREDEGWKLAVSHKTQRRHLKQILRREPLLASVTKGQENKSTSGTSAANEGDDSSFQSSEHSCREIKNQDSVVDSENVENCDGNKVQELSDESLDAEACSVQLDNLDIVSETGESVDASCSDDDSSEQSWTIGSLSKSTVACVTRDYAMQNVILQIGLRLFAPGGMQIRQLHRWVLKCHACFNMTHDIGRLFCPKCGNGGTLRKVSVTVNETGVIMAARRPRIITRGTRFSLPLPKGGREAIAKNPILREDQLPHRLLYPKVKKSVKKDADDFFCSDEVFLYRGGREQLKPPVKSAYVLFGGRRNPNDNHFSRRKR